MGEIILEFWYLFQGPSSFFESVILEYFKFCLSVFLDIHKHTKTKISSYLS